MKFNTVRKFPYAADYYSYKNVSTANGTVITKVYGTVPTKIFISMSVDLALGGAATVTGSDLGSVFIDCLTKLQIGGILKNITDAKNNIMYEGGGSWIVTMSAPYLGPNGIQEGYKYRLAQIEGNV